MFKYVFFLFFALTSVLNAEEIKSNEKSLKVLVLIIGYDKDPFYRELYKIWRAYMHRFPDEVEAYFIQGDPSLKNNCEVHGDVIWSKTKEGIRPGILNKTLMTLEFLLPRMHEFDYVLRTNLSSFYVFPRFIEFLKTLPEKNCYCGVAPGCENNHCNWVFASGAGFTMSPDIVQFLVKNKKSLMRSRDYDDVAIGKLLKKAGYSLIPASRIDFLTLDSWFRGCNSIPEDVFHFRIKNSDPTKRMTDELFVHWELYKTFYE